VEPPLDVCQVMWRKRQLSDDLAINMLSSINEPFVATARFRVDFAAVEPRYQLPLSISGTFPLPMHFLTAQARFGN